MKTTPGHALSVASELQKNSTVRDTLRLNTSCQMDSNATYAIVFAPTDNPLEIIWIVNINDNKHFLTFYI